MQKHDIYKRIEDFVVGVIGFIDVLTRSFSGRIIAKQLLRSATSVGANMQEADGAVSRKDFVNKVGIARKESQETRYWLNLLLKAKQIKDQEKISVLVRLHRECDEISKILSSIMNNARKNII